jgi:hypothetical protein
MHISRASLVLAVSVVSMGCGVDTQPPTMVGDVGDDSGQELKVACNLSRDQILASAQGDRLNAIQRGFSWYDAQVPYSQSSNYGGYRTDCSGFVSMCWELGTSYTTADFINDSGQWTSLGSFGELTPADAMVYRSGSSGHIMMFVGWNDSAQTEACVLEQASTAEDMQFRARTTDSLAASGYHAIRATKMGSGSSGAGGGSGGSGGQCYCDAQCAQYGDCCSNCSSGSGGSGGASGSGGTSGSGGQCYCDAQCAQYGDCCSNCSAGSGGSGGASGSGGSGGTSGSGGQCYCDAQCAQYGDCCAGCGAGGSGSGGSAGGGGQCYCDAQCAQYGDCCAGCGAGGSGSGGSAGGGGQCYCDSQCWMYGDCCPGC